ncbi:MAG TPA: squalene/phytoene synthase family protein [Thermoanaerobaculia bacterium]|nr:squalene/phytoene synthase family protein [Thermoanaerobaculia bacterium]
MPVTDTVLRDPELDRLLEATSRTFALSIPLLPDPTRSEVTIAYLLLRIADTFEDAALWPRERRIAALEDFADLLSAPPADCVARAEQLATGWAAELPSSHEGYVELLAATPFVLQGFCDLDPEARQIVAEHTTRTTRGMAGFVARTGPGGRLELSDEGDLRHYCYVVAGIVGEMLTELFLLHRPVLAQDAWFLRPRAAVFGEALQLVNILKDSSADDEEGRRFVPRGVRRDDIFRRARRDLTIATEYVLCLQNAQERGIERGLVAFLALPVLLAAATLDRVEAQGSGAKLTRPEVYAIVSELEQALDEGSPAVPGPGTG